MKVGERVLFQGRSGKVVGFMPGNMVDVRMDDTRSTERRAADRLAPVRGASFNMSTGRVARPNTGRARLRRNPEGALSKGTYEQLRDELQRRSDDRIKLAEEIEENRLLGDLSENQGYKDAKERQGLNEARIAQLYELLDTTVVDTSQQAQSDDVHFGATVVLVNRSGVEKTYRITDSYDTSHPENLSYAGAVGQTLLGTKLGDVIELDLTNSGELDDWQIVSVQYGKHAPLTLGETSLPEADAERGPPWRAVFPQGVSDESGKPIGLGVVRRASREAGYKRLSDFTAELVNLPESQRRAVVLALLAGGIREKTRKERALESREGRKKATTTAAIAARPPLRKALKYTEVEESMRQGSGASFFTTYDPPRQASDGRYCGNPIDGTGYYLIVSSQERWTNRFLRWSDFDRYVQLYSRGKIEKFLTADIQLDRRQQHSPSLIVDHVRNWLSQNYPMPAQHRASYMNYLLFILDNPDIIDAAAPGLTLDGKPIRLNESLKRTDGKKTWYVSTGTLHIRMFSPEWLEFVERKVKTEALSDLTSKGAKSFERVYSLPQVAASHDGTRKTDYIPGFSLSLQGVPGSTPRIVVRNWLRGLVPRKEREEFVDTIDFILSGAQVSGDTRKVSFNLMGPFTHALLIERDPDVEPPTGNDAVQGFYRDLIYLVHDQAKTEIAAFKEAKHFRTETTHVGRIRKTPFFQEGPEAEAIGKLRQRQAATRFVTASDYGRFDPHTGQVHFTDITMKASDALHEMRRFLPFTERPFTAPRYDPSWERTLPHLKKLHIIDRETTEVTTPEERFGALALSLHMGAEEAGFALSPEVARMFIESGAVTIVDEKKRTVATANKARSGQYTTYTKLPRPTRVRIKWDAKFRSPFFSWIRATNLAMSTVQGEMAPCLTDVQTSERREYQEFIRLLTNLAAVLSSTRAQLHKTLEGGRMESDWVDGKAHALLRASADITPKLNAIDPEKQLPRDEEDDLFTVNLVKLGHVLYRSPIYQPLLMFAKTASRVQESIPRGDAAARAKYLYDLAESLKDNAIFGPAVKFLIRSKVEAGPLSPAKYEHPLLGVYRELIASASLDDENRSDLQHLYGQVEPRGVALLRDPPSRKDYAFDNAVDFSNRVSRYSRFLPGQAGEEAWVVSTVIDKVYPDLLAAGRSADEARDLALRLLMLGYLYSNIGSPLTGSIALGQETGDTPLQRVINAMQTATSEVGTSSIGSSLYLAIQDLNPHWKIQQAPSTGTTIQLSVLVPKDEDVDQMESDITDAVRTLGVTARVERQPRTGRPTHIKVTSSKTSKTTGADFTRVAARAGGQIYFTYNPILFKLVQQFWKEQFDTTGFRGVLDNPHLMAAIDNAGRFGAGAKYVQMAAAEVDDVDTVSMMLHDQLEGGMNPEKARYMFVERKGDAPSDIYTPFSLLWPLGLSIGSARALLSTYIQDPLVALKAWKTKFEEDVARTASYQRAGLRPKVSPPASRLLEAKLPSSPVITRSTWVQEEKQRMGSSIYEMIKALDQKIAELKGETKHE